MGLFYQLFNREVIHSKLQIVTMGHFLYWGVEVRPHSIGVFEEKVKMFEKVKVFVKVKLFEKVKHKSVCKNESV